MRFDATDFNKTLANAVQYSQGFIDGVNSNEQLFLRQIAEVTKQGFYKFVDSNARIDSSSLHHVYEWGQVGEPSGRLFNLDAFIGSGFIRFVSKFLPSTSIPPTGNTPFYDKARIMEEGISVTIEPQDGGVLAFEGDDGEMVFTPNSVTIENPGGPDTEGSYEQVFREFFNNFLDRVLLGELIKNMNTPDEFLRGWGKGMNYRGGVRMGKRYATVKGGIG
jgi:hypothetical protein